MRNLFFWIFLSLLLGTCNLKEDRLIEKQASAVVEKSSIDNETYNKVKLGAEGLIVSYESLLNKMLADNISKEEREFFVKESMVDGDSGINQIFNNPDVIIEDDIGPDFYLNAKIKDLKVSRYLSDLYLFLKIDKGNAVDFDNIRTLQIKEGKDVFVIVYFESTIQGNHSLKDFPYKKTKRIATIKAEHDKGLWHYSIMSIGFYNV